MGFPAYPYPCAPLAIVTTSAGRVVEIEDRRINDANRAGVYRNDDDPSNVVRVTAGYVSLSDGIVVRYDPTTRTGLAGGTPNDDDLYDYKPTQAAVIDGEQRVSIGSWHFIDLVGPIGHSGVVTAYFWWTYGADEGVPFLDLSYGKAWPTTGITARAATISFNAIVRFNQAHTDYDYTAGEVLSVTDERVSFGV